MFKGSGEIKCIYVVKNVKSLSSDKCSATHQVSAGIDSCTLNT